MNALMQIDYGKLAEQYASFLSALGGVSITVLALVLSFGSETNKSSEGKSSGAGATDVNYRPSLIAALIVATVTCFVGAHLMAETAAFASHHWQIKVDGDPLPVKSGARLFLLASINIYIAILLVIFALMLLTAEYSKRNRDAIGIRRISLCVFGAVILSAFLWMFLSVKYRLPAPDRDDALLIPFIASVAVLLGCWGLFKHRQPNWSFWLTLTFISITLFTVLTLIWFVASLSQGYGGIVVRNCDVALFVATITLTIVSLGVCGIRLMRGGIDGRLLSAAPPGGGGRGRPQQQGA